MKIRVLLLLLLLAVGLSAEVATKDSVTKLYVATFDRAPDSAGLNYWVGTKMPLEDIASSFFDQDETKNLYGDVSDLDNFIVSIYNNLFKREPEISGQEYWKKELESGNFSSSLFILAVVNGAKGDDKAILDNKTEVGLAFADKGLTNLSDASSIMSGVDGREDTKLEALNKFGLGQKVEEVKEESKDSKVEDNSTKNPDTKVEDNTTKTPDTKVPDNTTSSEAIDALKRHNEIRAEVFSGSEIVWSDEIAKSAQTYAEILGAKGVMEHDMNSKYGENLAISSTSLSYTQATDMWYVEKSNYSYENGCESGKVCGHYTQIIWKNSTEFGCGSAVMDSGRFEGGTIVVCRYNPAGNYVNQKPY